MASKKKKRTGFQRLGFWLSVLTAVLVVIGMTILILLPYAMEWGAEQLLLRNGASTATIADIDFNPMTGHLTVFDLKVEGPNADRVAMERLLVKLDLFPLFKKRIYFREISLTGFYLDIRQHEDGTLTFAGLSLPEPQETASKEPEEDKETTPWGLGLRDLDVKEFTVRLITDGLDETVVLRHLNLTDFETWTPDKHGDHVIRVDLLGGTVDIEGTLQPFTDPIAVSTRIGLRDLALDQIMPYIKETPVGSLSGSLSGRGQVDVALSLQPEISVTSAIKLDIFSRDMDITAAMEKLELGIQPGGLNAGVSLDTSIDMGDSPARDLKFTANILLEETNARVDNKGTAIGIMQNALSFQINGSYSDTGSVDVSKLSANAGISLKGLTIKNDGGPDELLKVGSFDMEDVKISGADNIMVSQTVLKDMALLPRRSDSAAKKEARQVLSLGDMKVTGVNLSSGSNLAIEEVQMDALSAWVVREKGGTLEPLNILDSYMGTAQGTDDITQTNEKTSGKSGLTISLDKFTLTGENSLTFRDLSVEPPFDFVADSLSAQIQGLGTVDNSLPTQITVKAGMGKYSSISVSGVVQPPWDTPDIDMHANLKSIDLPPLTPYTTRYLGYILRSGHLNTDMDVLVEKGVLDSKAEIVVNRIDLDAVKKEDEQRAEERLGIPVNMALSLLKDKNDDIKLTLPIEGNTRDPEFKVADVIVGATGLALKKGVTAYYQGLGATLLTGGLIPPGTFGILGKVFSGVTTMTFEPVVYDPLATDLSEPAKTHLNLMAEKLTSKPNVRLVLCGKVAVDDILALRQADFETALTTAGNQVVAGTVEDTGVSKSPEPSGDVLTGENADDQADTVAGTGPTGPPTLEEVPLTSDEKARLIELAKQRALTVKDYLVETGGMDPERLFVCYSDVDAEKKDLPPRVDLSI